MGGEHQKASVQSNFGALQAMLFVSEVVVPSGDVFLLFPFSQQEDSSVRSSTEEAIDDLSR